MNSDSACIPLSRVILQSAILALSRGEFVVLYDGDDREGEADLIVGAKFATPSVIEKLRKEAGGLICLAFSKEDASKLSLPFYSDLLESNPDLKSLSCKKTAYGDKPAFSISINHKNVYTGIPDSDRSLTITFFDSILSDPNPKKSFLSSFYSPGHVFLLISSGLEKRKGHTELSVELARRSGLNSVVLCEMLGSGKALSRDEAILYAQKNGYVFLHANNILGDSK
jgi:3,4-dihydroxy 2-butanone 4-phosphate synthase